MRALFALLALLGLGGIVVGILTILRAGSGPDGVPFQFEHAGGPGPLIAGIILLSVSLYLLSSWRRKE